MHSIFHFKFAISTPTHLSAAAADTGAGMSASPKSFPLKMKDLVSCFYTCRLPPDEEPDTFKRSTPENPIGHGGCRRMAEDDYIEFCFREDGAIDVVNECGSSEEYSEYYPDEAHYSTAETMNQNTIHQENRTHNEGEAKRRIEWPSAEEIEVMEQQNGSKIEPFDSCDSNISDTSTSSFAFPVLGTEWIGSPNNMPRSEDCGQRTRRF